MTLMDHYRLFAYRHAFALRVTFWIALIAIIGWKLGLVIVGAMLFFLLCRNIIEEWVFDARLPKAPWIRVERYARVGLVNGWRCPWVIFNRHANCWCWMFDRLGITLTMRAPYLRHVARQLHPQICGAHARNSTSPTEMTK